MTSFVSSAGCESGNPHGFSRVAEHLEVMMAMILLMLTKMTMLLSNMDIIGANLVVEHLGFMMTKLLLMSTNVVDEHFEAVMMIMVLMLTNLESILCLATLIGSLGLLSILR